MTNQIARFKGTHLQVSLIHLVVNKTCDTDVKFLVHFFLVVLVKKIWPAAAKALTAGMIVKRQNFIVAMKTEKRLASAVCIVVN